MKAAPKLAGFAATLALLLGAGALAGSIADPDRGAAEAHGAMPAPVRGLGIAEGGLRLAVETPELRRGRTERLRFRVVDTEGATVRDFDVEHTRRMHLIVARRDLTGFQHLHPRQAPDGTWSAPLRLSEAGSYRMYADFSHDGTPRTLAGDLRVDGSADLLALPAPAPAAVSDGGYAVRLGTGPVRRGEETALRFAIAEDGRAVRPEPYLGAAGHLVALREGDLAFLHVHPGKGGYEVTFPTAGRYRLFLQFKHRGRVQTAAFTEEVR